MRGHWRGQTGALIFALAIAGLPTPHAAAQEAETAETEGAEAGNAEEEATSEEEGATEAEAEAGADEETEEERTARARELFGEGIELVEQERWEEAAAKFRATLELKPAPAVRYNLASALYSSGQVTEAEVLVDAVLDDPETDDTIRGHAQDLQAVIRDEAGMIRVELAGDVVGSTVAIDGYELPENRIGIDVSAAPGAHVVTATRDGQEVAREEATVTVGETTDVRLAVAPSADTAAAAGLEDGGGGTGGGSSSELISDWRLWAAVGATVAVVATAIILIAVTTGGTEDPVEGNFEPGVLRW